MTLSVIYLLLIVPAFAIAAGCVAVGSARRSAERVREIERQRSAG